MNLLEFFLNDPQNYHLRGGGGAGKTSSIQYMHRMLLEGEYSINGQRLIPIYIKMNQFNLMKVEFHPIQSYIAEKYFEDENYKSVNKMFREFKDYRFVLLLDGVNEVLDGMATNCQKIYTLFENELNDLVHMENIYLIVSTRVGGDIFYGKQCEKFRNINMKALGEHQIVEYTGNNAFAYDAFEEILSNPMMLRMYKIVSIHRPEQVTALSNKYQLMEHYISIDTNLQVDGYAADTIREVREFITARVLPYIAYRIEEELVNLNGASTINFNSFLKEALEEHPALYGDELIKRVLQAMDYSDHTLMHDLIREFMALREWNRRVLDKYEKTRDFIENLIKQIEYTKDTGKDLRRRTRHLDIVELLLGEHMTELECFLCNVCDDNKAKEVTQLLFQEVAGVYEDLGDDYDDKAAKYAWISNKLLDELQNRNLLSPYEYARRKNFLYYCCLNGTKDKYPNPMQLLEDALNALENCKEDSEIVKLYGNLLSNRGAYYYSMKWGHNISRALEYHIEALNFREENEKKNNNKENRKDVNESLRTIMSDYFQMKEYEKSYEVFKKIIKRKVKERNDNYTLFSQLNPELDWDYIGDLEGVILRGMGSEGMLLESVYREEIIEELCYQIPFVFKRYTDGSRRIDRKSLNDLYEKLNGLKKRNSLVGKTQEVVDQYIEKCKERLEVF